MRQILSPRWLLPLAFAVHTSLRPFDDTNTACYLSLPQTLDLDNYIEAWNQSSSPLTRPALAALATLQVTWVYNDFFWAIVLMAGRGPKMPVTSALNALRGQFFTDYNLLSAGAILVALPTLIVFFALQKPFINGLTLGSTKG